MDDTAIDFHAAGENQFFALAAAANSGGGKNLLQSLGADPLVRAGFNTAGTFVILLSR
jgi:hypothetical protein